MEWEESIPVFGGHESGLFELSEGSECLLYKVHPCRNRELQGKNGYTLQYSDGRNVTTHFTGSTVCVAERNRKYAGADGIPYLGGATCDLGAWSAKSHPQVRNESFLSDHYNSVSAVKGVKENTSGKLAQRQEEKRAEWKKEDQARAHEEAQEWAEERREQREKLLQAVREEWLEAKEAVACMSHGPFFEIGI